MKLEVKSKVYCPALQKDVNVESDCDGKDKCRYFLRKNIDQLECNYYSNFRNQKPKTVMSK